MELLALANWAMISAEAATEGKRRKHERCDSQCSFVHVGMACSDSVAFLLFGEFIHEPRPWAHVVPLAYWIGRAVRLGTLVLRL
jgi:hypothetical protein